MTAMKKSFPAFDCDGHITELAEIWDYLSAKEKETVKPWFWADGNRLIVNGNKTGAALWAIDRMTAAVIEASGPGVTKKQIRKLRSMDLTPEQRAFTNYKGARDPHARVVDMDLQGIDQVVVIPISMLHDFPFVENIYAAQLIARAYNDWVYDWCSVAPERIFPAAALPAQDGELAAQELRRVAEKGFKLAMVRAADIQRRYPNHPNFEPLWNAFEETGLVTAMHSLTAGEGVQQLASDSKQWSPGMFLERAITPAQMSSQGSRSQTLSFVHEAMTWIPSVLLSGFFERHPKVTMAIMESNASWLPMLLDSCDKSFHLYKNERTSQVTRLPSESFMERCFIAFEGDEEPVYRQYSFFQDIGIWSSDVYHHDGSDAWSAIARMEKLEVPENVQAKILGGNAYRMYGIEPKLFVTDEPESYSRPEWYPKTEEIEQEFAGLMARR